MYDFNFNPNWIEIMSFKYNFIVNKKKLNKTIIYGLDKQSFVCFTIFVNNIKVIFTKHDFTSKV